MKITTRLMLSFLLVSVMPLAVTGYLVLRAMQRTNLLAVQESNKALRQLGEASIHQKAVDVARQIELYLEAHPQLIQKPVEKWGEDPELASIAVQAVGQTGYTALYDSDGIVYLHANPRMIGRNMEELATDFPDFWAIFKASLDGTPAASYYLWQDADHTVREKYMSCVPVGDTPFRIAATTYIDEFSQPMRQTEASISAIFKDIQRQFTAFLIVMAVLSIVLAVWLALGISRPILAITEAAQSVEAGQFDLHPLERVDKRSDELGQLARVFQRMARQVYIREENLKIQVQELRIEIDEAKKRQQVEEITESEYFRLLQQRVAMIKARRAMSGLG